MARRSGTHVPKSPTCWLGEGLPSVSLHHPRHSWTCGQEACRRGGGLSMGEAKVSSREPHPTPLPGGTVTINNDVPQALSRVLGSGWLHAAPALALPKLRSHRRPGWVPTECSSSMLRAAFLSLVSRTSPSSLWPISLSNHTGWPTPHLAAACPSSGHLPLPISDCSCCVASSWPCCPISG